MPDKEAIDTRGTNWQNWSIRLPLPLFIAIVSGLWAGFDLYNLIHENESEIQRIEGRLDKIRDRLESDVDDLERILHEIECPEQ